jgi:hypothetical protein
MEGGMTWLALIALLLPMAAHAGPVIAIAVAYATGATAVQLAVMAVFAAYTIYSSVDARREQRRLAAKARDEYNSRLSDRSVTLLSAKPPWQIVYGRCIVGGFIVANFTSDKTGTRENGTSYTKPDGYRHLVVEFAHHECEDIHEIYLDGVALGTLDGSGWVTGGTFFETRTDTRTATISGSGHLDVGGVVTSILHAYYSDADGNVDVTPTLSLGDTRINNPSSNAIWVDYTVQVGTPGVRWSKHLGASTQTVDTYLNGVCPTEWTTNHRLRGATYITITFDLENPRFTGAPPNITADVSGRKVYDPRTGLTAWSDNPPLCINDWLTNVWGYGCDDDEVNAAYLIAAANACDEVMSYGKKYTCNGAITTDQTKEAVLADLEECMAGRVAYGADWMIMAGSWTAPVTLPGGGGLTDDDLHGQIDVVQVGTPTDSLFNGLRGSYIPSGSATPTDIRPPYQNSTFVAADGDELWQDITLPFTDDGTMARQIARVMTERNRSGLVIKYPAKLRAITLQVGDRVTVTSTEYGFSSKTFRVTDKHFSLTTPVVLHLQEDTEDSYDEVDAATADPTPNTGLSSPWVVGALTGLTLDGSDTYMITSGSGQLIPRVLVSWDAVTTPYVASNGRIEVMWRHRDEAWQQVNVTGSDTSVFITGVKHDDRIVVQARAVIPGFGIGPWVLASAAVDAPTLLYAVYEKNDFGSINVTGTSGTGSSYASTTRWTSVGTFTFTPSFTGTATVELSGVSTFFGTGTIYTFQVIGELIINVDLNNDATVDSGEDFADIYMPIPWDNSANVSGSMPFFKTKDVSVTAGVTLTWPIYAKRLESTVTTTLSDFKIRVTNFRATS